MDDGLVEMVVESVRVHMLSSRHVVILKEAEPRSLPADLDRAVGGERDRDEAPGPDPRTTPHPRPVRDARSRRSVPGSTGSSSATSPTRRSTPGSCSSATAGRSRWTPGRRTRWPWRSASGVGIFAATRSSTRRRSAGRRPRSTTSRARRARRSRRPARTIVDPRLDVFRDFVNSLDVRCGGRGPVELGEAGQVITTRPTCGRSPSSAQSRPSRRCSRARSARPAARPRAGRGGYDVDQVASMVSEPVAVRVDGVGQAADVLVESGPVVDDRDVGRFGPRTRWAYQSGVEKLHQEMTGVGLHDVEDMVDPDLGVAWLAGVDRVEAGRGRVRRSGEQGDGEDDARHRRARSTGRPAGAAFGSSVAIVRLAVAARGFAADRGEPGLDRDRGEDRQPGPRDQHRPEVVAVDVGVDVGRGEEAGDRRRPCRSAARSAAGGRRSTTNAIGMSGARMPNWSTVRADELCRTCAGRFPNGSDRLPWNCSARTM